MTFDEYTQWVIEWYEHDNYIESNMYCTIVSLAHR